MVSEVTDRRSRRLARYAAAMIGWLIYLGVTIRYLVVSVQRAAEQPFLIHYDWHAYLAGATDLIDRTLYREELRLGDVPLPLSVFNLPPLAALEAAVLLPLGRMAGGVAWQIVGATALAGAAIGLLRVSGLRWLDAVANAGILLGLYQLVDHLILPDELSYWWGLTLGTNNYLMLGLIAAFAVSFRAERDGLASVALATAIATKLWPVALGVLIIRERRWRVAAWTTGLVLAQGIVWLIWLGADAVPLGIRALGAEDPDPTGVLGLAALRGVADWLPTWIGWLVAAALLAIPARGHLGMGLGILAGLSAITNLWGHYLPTVLFATGLVIAGLVRRAGAGRETRGSAPGSG